MEEIAAEPEHPGSVMNLPVTPLALPAYFLGNGPEWPSPQQGVSVTGQQQGRAVGHRAGRLWGLLQLLPLKVGARSGRKNR